jgi:hypothetical protein
MSNPPFVRALETVVVDPATGRVIPGAIVIQDRNKVQMSDGGPLPKRLLKDFKHDDHYAHNGRVVRLPTPTTRKRAQTADK